MILIVDDDDSVREMLRRVLEGEGHGVETAANGAEALEIAAAIKLDLVLLDLNLPAMGGWEIFEKLTHANPLLAVIIMTARSGQSTMARGAGVSMLLEKPLDIPSLVRAVALALSESDEARLARLTGRAHLDHLQTSRPKQQSKTNL